MLCYHIQVHYNATTFKCITFVNYALVIYVRSLELAGLYFKFEPYNDALRNITLLYLKQ